LDDLEVDKNIIKDPKEIEWNDLNWFIWIKTIGQWLNLQVHKRQGSSWPAQKLLSS
jgi:hypothetical protein